VLNHKIWQDELNRQLTRQLHFMSLIKDKSPPLPWYRRKWNLLRYRVSEFRERVGEVVAGRRFDDY
jgi:hypothetical protein